MDLTNIKTFLQVVDSGNVAKAAEILRYAPSTVTAQIQALEKELGVPLFERIGRKNHLTAEGQELLRHATDLQNILRKVSSVGQHPKETAFSLRIGTLQSLLFYTFLDVLPLFRQAYPNAQISIKLGNTLELREMLRKNQLDIIYISSPLNTDPSLNCLCTQKVDMVFVSGTGHKLAGRTRIPLEDALQYPFVLSDPTGQSYQTIHELVSNAGLSIRCPVSVNDNTAISILLRDNISLSFLPRPAASSPYIENLVVLDVDVSTPTYYRQVLVRKNIWISPVILDLLSLIEAHDTGER